MPRSHSGAHLETTTTRAAYSLSPRRRSGERGFKTSQQFEGTSPSPPALSPLVPRREREQETSAMVRVSRCARHSVEPEKKLAISGLQCIVRLTQSHGVTGRGSSFMGTGIAGFRQCFFPRLQTMKSHRRASCTVSRAFSLESDKQRSSRRRKARRICRNVAGRRFEGSVMASIQSAVRSCLGHPDPNSHSMEAKSLRRILFQN